MRKSFFWFDMFVDRGAVVISNGPMTSIRHPPVDSPPLHTPFRPAMWRLLAIILGLPLDRRCLKQVMTYVKCGQHGSARSGRIGMSHAGLWYSYVPFDRRKWRCCVDAVPLVKGGRYQCVARLSTARLEEDVCLLKIRDSIMMRRTDVPYCRYPPARVRGHDDAGSADFSGCISSCDEAVDSGLVPRWAFQTRGDRASADRSGAHPPDRRVEPDGQRGAASVSAGGVAVVHAPLHDLSKAW